MRPKTKTPNPNFFLEDATLRGLECIKQDMKALRSQIKKDSHDTLHDSFLTGSRVYGEPSVDSDLDVVVFVDPRTLAVLSTILGAQEFRPYDRRAKRCKIGGLDLILTSDFGFFEDWKMTTQVLQAVAPVSKEQAIAVKKIICG